MKKFDVYAVGNALVDFEVEVSEQQLEQLKIEKGIMTLIDAERHHVLMGHLEGTRHNRACGGSAANSIIALSQLGGKSFYSCRVADDEAGDFFLNDLQSHGVEINQNSHRPESVTGKCIVMVTPDADRTMNTYLGVTGELGRDVLDKEAIKNSKYLYIEGYLSSAPLALEAACEAKKVAEENQVKVAFTLSDPSMVRFFREGIDTLIGKGVDMLFCNEDEALEYTGQATLEQAIPLLKQIAKTFVITLGEKGSMICDGEKEIVISAEKVDAIDTNGAGDMFAGAFLYMLCQGHDFELAGQLANFASAKVVQKFGPRLNAEEAIPVQKFAGELTH